MNTPDAPSPVLSRRDRELSLFALAATDPARAAADYDALVEIDEPWSLPVPIALATFIARRLPPADADAFLARQTPVWPMLLESLARRFDPDSTGFVQWPSRDTDLFPELAHPGAIAPDAAILLSNEARLYLDAADRFPALRPASDIAQAVNQDTDSTLVESLWDAENQCLLCTAPDGSPAVDATARSLFPLVWKRLPRPDGDAISAASASAFPAGGTPAAWILLVAFLADTPWRRVFADCCRRPLPPGATPAETAAHSALVAALAPRPASPRLLAPLARHPALVAAAAVALLATAALAAVLALRTPSTPLSVVDQAREAALAGDHAAAADLYDRAAAESPLDATRLAFLAANERFRAGDYRAAETAYRTLLADNPDTPSAALNLALSVLRQGRTDAAIALYRHIADSPTPSATPDAIARARDAAAYLSSIPR